MRSAFITGDAGFVGFHLARRLLSEGWRVTGYDALTPYYDVRLKAARRAILRAYPHYAPITADIAEAATLDSALARAKPDIVVHLAAQAGVRYSLENPGAYVRTNILGSFNLLDSAKRHGVAHALLASTSSAYGAQDKFPFEETDRAAHPLTIYAASKLAMESIAHSSAHLGGPPCTLFRFFTVYGPWGRPDMAPHKFASAILAGRPIELFNGGDMARDFTYVGDIVEGVRRLIDHPPPRPEDRAGLTPIPGDSLSPVAAWRLANIGAGRPVELLDFVAALEESLGRKAQRRLLPMQPGDAPRTWAATGLLEALTGWRAQTDVREGVRRFAEWHVAHYGAERAEPPVIGPSLTPNGEAPTSESVDPVFNDPHRAA